MTDIPMSIEIDCTTGVVSERPLTAEEITQRDAEAAAWAAHVAAEQAAQAAQDAARTSALAKLAALGLTPDEAAAMFGA